jgi:hypothetical protein
LKNVASDAGCRYQIHALQGSNTFQSDAASHLRMVSKRSLRPLPRLLEQKVFPTRQRTEVLSARGFKPLRAKYATFGTSSNEDNE